MALVDAGRMPAEGKDEREQARLSYVGLRGRPSGWCLGRVGAGCSLRGYRDKARPDPEAEARPMAWHPRR